MVDNRWPQTCFVVMHFVSQPNGKHATKDDLACLTTCDVCGVGSHLSRINFLNESEGHGLGYSLAMRELF